jgi:hypothetical protein
MMGFRDWLVGAGVDFVANAPLCMFVSKTCIELLASVFGASQVHVVSYDGAKAAGRSLLDVVACDVAKLACRDGKLGREASQNQSEKFENVSPLLGAYSASALFNLAAQRLQCAARMPPTNESARDLYSSAAAAALCLPVEELTVHIRRSHFLCDGCFHTYY